MTLSALADRLAFAGWGLAAALVYSWALRYGFEVGSPLTLGLLTAALAFFSLAWLVGRYQESLDLGYRAFLPGLYQSWILRPGVIAGLGFVSGWGAGLSWQRSREWRKSR